MAMGSGLLALALLAADEPSCSPEETTTYQVRVVTLDGLDWRTASYSRLTPVARQGTSAIWTADKTLASVLADRASSVASVGKVMASSDTILSQAKTVNYVAAMERVADGPINQSSAIAFMPRPEMVEERFAIRLVGRKLDQGLLTRVTLEETHVDGLHTVNQTESLKPSPAKVNRTPIKFSNDGMVTQSSVETPTSLTTQVQIPEVSQTRIDGEWLIPKDGVLLISLGVKTAANDEGKAVARERLAIIEVTTPVDLIKAWSEGEPATVIKTSNLSSPTTPSRSLPRAVDSNGSIVDLPPLPEALASNDLDRIKPEPNQPSPQSSVIAEPEADPSIARTSFDAAPPAPNPPLVEVAETTGNARMARLKKLQEALAKAGFDLDLEALDKTTAVAPKPVCEKCDGDTLFCPAEYRPLSAVDPATGTKFAPAQAASLGVTVKDVRGVQVQTSELKLGEALKTPGKTETTLIPLGGHVTLEIKATLVPTASTTAAKDKPTTSN